MEEDTTAVTADTRHQKAIHNIQTMTENDSLDDIAEQIGEVTHEQDHRGGALETTESSDDFDPEDFMVDVEEYDGGWDTSH